MTPRHWYHYLPKARSCSLVDDIERIQRDTHDLKLQIRANDLLLERLEADLFAGCLKSWTEDRISTAKVSAEISAEAGAVPAPEFKP